LNAGRPFAITDLLADATDALDSGDYEALAVLVEGDAFVLEQAATEGYLFYLLDNSQFDEGSAFLQSLPASEAARQILFVDGSDDCLTIGCGRTSLDFLKLIIAAAEYDQKRSLVAFPGLYHEIRGSVGPIRKRG